MTKEWYLKNKERMRLYVKEWQKSHRENMRRNQQMYFRNNIQCRLASNLRHRTRRAMKYNKRLNSAIKELGCTLSKLKEHLSSKFTQGMTWENYGRWHIDHIIPLSSFDLTNKEHFLKASHYKNLQPLWSIDNIMKSNKLLEGRAIQAPVKKLT